MPKPRQRVDESGEHGARAVRGAKVLSDPQKKKTKNTQGGLGFNVESRCWSFFSSQASIKPGLVVVVLFSMLFKCRGQSLRRPPPRPQAPPPPPRPGSTAPLGAQSRAAPSSPPAVAPPSRENTGAQPNIPILRYMYISQLFAWFFCVYLYILSDVLRPK